MLTKTGPAVRKRPAQRPKSTRQPTQQHAANDALLACPLDLPKLSRAIPRTISISSENAQYNRLTDSMLQLAIIGSEVPDFAIDPMRDLAANVVSAADAALNDVLRHGNLNIKYRWWGSQQAATRGSQPHEEADGDTDHLESESYFGANLVIELDHTADGGEGIEFVLSQLNTSEPLNAYESVCPGFTHMLYTVLEKVDHHIWPVITPRTLWDDYINGGAYGGGLLCDLDTIRDTIFENLDTDEIAEKYGYDEFESIPPAELITVYEEEIGGYLPSDFRKEFGSAAIGGWPIYAENSPHEAIPYPCQHLLEDLNIAICNMQLRTWCATAPKVEACLEQMRKVFMLIKDGAKLATGTHVSSAPSHNAFQIFPFSNASASRFYTRVLDDVAQGAMENGNVLNCSGWFNEDLSTPHNAQSALTKLRDGVHALHITTELLTELYWKPEP